MKDPEIRQILNRTELSKFHDDSNSKVVNELILPVANARIDMAVINGSLHGYEIKSASDTLKRLNSQIIAYSKVFDYLTIVTEHKYQEKILNIIPEWVGLSICSDKTENKEFISVKKAKKNLDKDGFFVAKLLWRQELLEVLIEQNIPFKKNQRNWILCDTLSGNLEIEKLSKIVREKLKKRGNWKN